MSIVGRPVIDVVGIGKHYRLHSAERTLKDTLGALASNLRSPTRSWWQKPTAFWALRDISFEVGFGEVVGIIGENGAGKSTLLKILSRITEPTTGTVSYSGHVGSLLEVGTGFHSELSGRDNIFLNGAILGMRRRDVARRFDEIVSFAGVERFIDIPVKRYSSGMYLRLAFAVAAHLDTEILLVDEVLAVGDAAFQKKCLARMGEVARGGRTILFVSHNLTAIKALCKRTLALKSGHLVADGETGRVLTDYLKGILTADTLATKRQWTESEAPISDKICMISASVRPEGGTLNDPIDVATSFVIELYYRNLAAGTLLHVGLTMHDQQGLLLFDGTGSWEPPVPLAVGLYRSRCKLPGDLLNDGVYSLTLTFRERDEVLLEVPNILQVEIMDNEHGRDSWFGKWGGVLRPHFEWITERVEGDTS